MWNQNVYNVNNGPRPLFSANAANPWINKVNILSKGPVRKPESIDTPFFPSNYCNKGRIQCDSNEKQYGGTQQYFGNNNQEQREERNKRKDVHRNIRSTSPYSDGHFGKTYSRRGGCNKKSNTPQQNNSISESRESGSLTSTPKSPERKKDNSKREAQNTPVQRQKQQKSKRGSTGSNTKSKKKFCPEFKWNFEKDICLLEYYKERPSLWDSSNPQSGDNEFNRRLLDALAKKLNTDVPEVKDRFSKFRERFTVEVHKIESAEVNGVEYNVKWKYFSNVIFLLGNRPLKPGIVKAEILLEDSEAEVEVPNIKIEAEEPVISNVETIASIPQEQQWEVEAGKPNNEVEDETPNNEVVVEILNNEVVEPAGGSRIGVPTTHNIEQESKIVDPRNRNLSLGLVESPSPVVTIPRAPSNPGLNPVPTEETFNQSFSAPVINFVASDSVNLDTELFSKQVALHLNSLTPYYREMSKLRIQEIMTHFSLRSQGYQLPADLSSVPLPTPKKN